MACELFDFVGFVAEIPSKNRAIVQFHSENQVERALLFYHRLRIDGDLLPPGLSISEFIKIGTILKFKCHRFDDTKKDKCGWYIVAACHHEGSAWLQEGSDFSSNTSSKFFQGLHNCKGKVIQVSEREGYLSYKLDGIKEEVFFLACDVYLAGKRLSPRTSLNQLLTMKPGKPVMFDAVPCNLGDNPGSGSWLATAVWKGSKPSMVYDNTPQNHMIPPSFQNLEINSLLPVIKQITSNPQSLFLRSTGLIAQIINNEYAIALGQVNMFHHEFVLIHRSTVKLFYYFLANTDLQTIFEVGDRIRFVAAANNTAGSMGPRWIASAVTVYIDPFNQRKFELKYMGIHKEPKLSSNF